MKKIILLLVGSLSLTACNYSNTFTGMYNNSSATLDAYSKNINRYCVALTLRAGNITKSSFISAQAVFDQNDFLKPVQFNTKGAPCSQSLDEYLVGERNTQVYNISVVTESEPYGANYCRLVSYKRYQYQEMISFELKTNSDDQSQGIFKGVGEMSYYVDYVHPVSYGGIYFCNYGNGGGFPYPYPYPNPRWPGGGTHVPGGGPQGPRPF